ncbi:uncharacterized protein BXZ73DRAFT_47739 [Epithele typhae]|uniref:uncharacterized protein n=1 Tax=Epithele typhae TaxID=378194 RepID=UPI002007E777|nr:uncharacterized protein BXZ73DRAFT_47739 [Epithele typhae]KAH9930510.1 hypothetical protein BXZ73DRAFT_47739 [Epithele typhae]
MPLVSASIDAFLILAIAVLIPALVLFRHHASHRAFSFRDALALFVLLHSLFVLYVLVVRWPPNVFQRLKIPLNAHSDHIRALLLHRAGLARDAALPQPLESLLTRLESFDMRTLYVRFGQTVLQDCEYCNLFNEFALYAAPQLALGYGVEGAVVGLVTAVRSGREQWRPYGVAALVGAALAEAFWLATAPIDIPRDGLGVFMWHDNLRLLRLLLFLLLPPLILILPFPFPSAATLQSQALAPATVDALAAAQNTLADTKTRLNALRFLNAAAAREPALRAASAAFWDRQREEGAIARADPYVRQAARDLGRGFATEGDADAREVGGANGPMRVRVRAFARTVMELVAPPQAAKAAGNAQ